MALFRNLQVRPFSDLATKGRGFVVGDKRFIHHSTLPARSSAVTSITATQKKIFFGAVVGVLLLLLVDFFHTVLIGVIVLTSLYFFDLLFNVFLVFRSFARSPEITVSPEEIATLSAKELPIITIFCPLYREANVLPAFIEAIGRLDYPHSKLQVLLLLEQNDQETVQAAREAELPYYFKIVVVPHGLPKTKPKAMNYGLKRAKGEFVVVYDAEDKPEPDQLKKAVWAFRKSSPETVCVQAKLNFYNPTQNILTKLFTAEYSLWFDLILPGLQSVNAPIPLGGTSNIFKTQKIKALGGWDAYNVTEDCDLGIRLAKHGYKTAMVDSTTFEEANSGVHNWYRQRSRWIKGYMQTYLVHMRRPKELWHGWKRPHVAFLQLVVGGKVLSMFVNPFLWLITLLYFVFRSHVATFIEPYFPPLVLYIGVFSLIFGNFLYLYSYMIGLARRGRFDLIKFAFFVPVYWLAMSVAAWRALYELIVKPHYWQKTVHGLHLAKEGAVVSSKYLVVSGRLPVIKEVVSVSAEVEELPSVVFDTQYSMQGASAVTSQTMTSSLPYPEPLEADKSARYTWRSNVKGYMLNVLRILGLSELSSGLWLIAAMMCANFLNFLFSAVLGRRMTPQDFGTVSLFTTIILLTGVVTGSLGGSITYRVGRLLGRKQNNLLAPFTKTIARRALVVGLLSTVLWLALASTLAKFFNIGQSYLVFAFAPIFPIMVSQGIWSGFLRGDFAFKLLAFSTLADPVVKLSFAAVLVYAGRTDLAPLAIIVAVLAGWATVWGLGRRHLNSSQNIVVSSQLNQDAPTTDNRLLTTFPKKYFTASLVSGAASTLFLTADVLLVKHYFNPTHAGHYALLSLCGNMIFYLCSLPNIFVGSVVSRAKGEEKDPRAAFIPLFRVVVALAVAGFVSVGLFGKFTVPLLFGANAQAILPYLIPYTAALGLMAITSSYIGYRLARDDYRFAWFSISGAVAMGLGIVLYHDTIGQVASVVLIASSTVAGLLFVFHAVTKHGRFIFRNFVDLLDVFAPLPEQINDLRFKIKDSLAPGKRILIFNWRDTKHIHAGGAEVYVHELAKRWSVDGNSVTIFCGSDGRSDKFETIDGVHIIRRGGFFMVYVWAVLYYMFRLRGKFDYVVDTDSALPFFTPLFVREPVVALVHHIHQEIFKRHLSVPAASLACFLEAKVMPFVYRHTQLLTVSNSTKLDMEALGLFGTGIEVINPGVNLQELEPGSKAKRPLITYVGRLKAYKSVDTLLRAFELVKLTNPEASLVIAGSGEEEGNLRELAAKLGLTSAIKFFGKVTEEMKLLLMQRAWVFVNPSSMEGWGITSIEANACGTPVVASNVPGLRDSVQNPHTGYLVQQGSPAAFAEKINLLLQDKEQRKFMEGESLEWAKRFDWDDQARRAFAIVLKSQNPEHSREAA